MDIQELCGWNVEPDIGLDGFEIDLVGFPCSREVEHDDPNIRPFNPGCGAKSYTADETASDDRAGNACEAVMLTKEKPPPRREVSLDYPTRQGVAKLQGQMVDFHLKTNALHTFVSRRFTDKFARWSTS